MYAIEVQAQVAERQQRLRRRFTWALLRGRSRALWSRLRHKSAGLLDLTSVLDQRSIRAVRSAGTQPVPIGRIRDSEGRCHDFDRAFDPRRTYTRDRWLHVARAWRDGIELAPVDLIQVGDVYFVRDGHHRISVATTFGQREIDARVTVWEVDDALARIMPTSGQATRQTVHVARSTRRAGDMAVGAGHRATGAPAGAHACTCLGGAPGAAHA